MEEYCLFDTCEEEPKARGLCATHYSYAFRLVKEKKITWDELVKQGKALASHSKSRSKVIDWFLNGKEKVERVQE